MWCNRGSHALLLPRPPQQTLFQRERPRGPLPRTLRPSASHPHIRSNSPRPDRNGAPRGGRMGCVGRERRRAILYTRVIQGQNLGRSVGHGVERILVVFPTARGSSTGRRRVLGARSTQPQSGEWRERQGEPGGGNSKSSRASRGDPH